MEMTMRKLLFIVAALGVFSAKANAADASFEIGYSSMVSVGVRCTTGTVVGVNLTRPAGFKANLAGYRIQNHDSAESVWLGGPLVSTATVLQADPITNLGEKLTPGASAPWGLGKNYMASNTVLVPIYCKAEDAAGVAGVVISVVWFGY